MFEDLVNSLVGRFYERGDSVESEENRQIYKVKGSLDSFPYFKTDVYDTEGILQRTAEIHLKCISDYSHISEEELPWAQSKLEETTPQANLFPRTAKTDKDIADRSLLLQGPHTKPEETGELSSERPKYSPPGSPGDFVPW